MQGLEQPGSGIVRAHQGQYVADPPMVAHVQPAQVEGPRLLAAIVDGQEVIADQPGDRRGVQLLQLQDLQIAQIGAIGRVRAARSAR